MLTMQKFGLTGLLFYIFMLPALHAQKFSGLQKSPTDIVYAKSDRSAKPDIKVIYSRPQKRDRQIFGDLVKYGKVWRTGADEATEIKFYKKTKLGKHLIEAGTYSLFTIPGKKDWEIIISSDLDSWGAYSYDPAKDVARIKVPAKSGDVLEAFSIAFVKNSKNEKEKGYNMVMAWDTTRVTVPFLL